MKRFVTALVLVQSICFVAAASSVKLGSVTDFLLPDAGHLIGDNMNTDAIIRLNLKQDGTSEAEISTTKRKERPMSSGGAASLGSYSVQASPFSYVYPDVLLATLTLNRISPYEFEITDIRVPHNQMHSMIVRGLIFKKGGILNFDGTADFGRSFIEYRKSKTAAGYREIGYAAATIRN